MMNDICFSRCQVHGAEEKEQHIVLSCSTIVLSESGSPMDCSLSVFMPVDIYLNPRMKQVGLKPGAYLKFTGKTVCNSVGNRIHFDMLLETPRRVEPASKTSDAFVVLFDAVLAQQGYRMYRDYMEAFLYYSNSPTSKRRFIIVRTDMNHVQDMKREGKYNFSGPLRMRLVDGNMMPVVKTETFVRDIVLTEFNVPIKMAKGDNMKK